MKFLTMPLPEEILREEGLGNFQRAEGIVKERLGRNPPEPLKKRLEYELERIKRVIKDYPHTEKKARKKLFDSVDGFSEEEYADLEKRGYLDYLMIEGEKRFEQKFFENLVFALPEYKKRTREDEKIVRARECLHARLDDLLSGNSPKTYKVVAEIKVRPDLDRISGEKLRCWLPFPKTGYPVLSARLLECSHAKFTISPNDSPQRTIYMEDARRKDLEFFTRFEYVIQEQVRDIDPGRVVQSKYSEFLREYPPHIIFREHIRELTSNVVGEEKNPYLVAKKIYDWITLNVRYSFTHAYSVYENLSEFASVNMRGDCGVQALLFITMCRIAGVPATWQSGWSANPAHVGPHDWALFHVEPYGWLPADLSFGGARRETPKYREFYFGNLDAFRMIANSEFMTGFTPPKLYWRTDPTDNQAGELETENQNVYYDSFKYEMNILSFDEVDE